MAVEGDKISPTLPCTSNWEGVCSCSTHTRIFNTFIRTQIAQIYKVNSKVSNSLFFLHCLQRSSEFLQHRKRQQQQWEWKKWAMVQSDCFCPLYFILSYKRHCLPWPDEYLICICCFICMLYNLGLYNHNSSREAAVPAIFSCRTSCSPRGEPGKACQGFHPLSPILPILLPHQCTNLCGSECFHRPEFKGILNCAFLK